MNTLTATRLGKVDAGNEEKGGSKTGKENLAAPIVLWSKDTSGIPLYFSSDVNITTNSITQKIDYLVSPSKGIKGRLKALTDAYPITFRGHGILKKEDENKLNAFNEIYSKDINGDGIDELIIIRSKGGIEVYDRQKQIHKYKPKSDPKLYEFKISRSYNNLHDHDEIGNHDEMFFTIEQDPYDRKHATSRDTWIVRLSPAGFTEIHPVFPDHSEPAGIISVIGMNRPGSNKIDELIVISQIKGQKGDYLSRHNLDGTGIDAPREIYTDFDSTTGAFGFAGSNQIIFNNAQEKILYFVTPDKPVNWIKTIDLQKLFGKDADVNILGEKVINNIAVLILEDRGKLYALDVLGKFHTSMKPDSHISNTPVAFMILKPDSDKHRIINIQPTDKTMESYLVIQSRDPSMRELMDEELEKMGKRFLKDLDWNDCRENLRLKYRETTHELAESYCEDHKIPMPEVHSWEDIKKKLPGFYEQKVRETQNSYINSISSRLLKPIERESYVLKEGAYKNMDEYKKWLSDIYFAPELVVSIQHISKGNIVHQRLSDYYFKDLAYGNGQRIPSISARTDGEHGRAYMVLHKKTAVDKKATKPAYYTIAW